MKLYLTLFCFAVVIAARTACAPSCRADAEGSYLFEAESLAEKRELVCYMNKGYGMVKPEHETGGWLLLQSKRIQAGAFVPQEPQYLKMPAGIPAGSYRLGLRVLRWVATEGAQPTPLMRVTVGEKSYEHRFEPKDGSLYVTGGVYRGEARWTWVELPEAIAVEARPLDIGVAAGPGDSNYLGLLVDAIRLTPVQGAARPAAAAWKGDVTTTRVAGSLPGTSSFALLVNNGGRAAVAESTIAAGRGAGYIVGWVRAELPLKSAQVRIDDGRNTVDIPLTQLVRIEPLPLSWWYMICVPQSLPALKPLNSASAWQVRVTAAPKAEEVRLQTSDWKRVSAAEVNRWKAADYDSATISVEPPTAAESLCLNVMQELSVNTLMRSLTAQAVGKDKKVIIWPHANLPGGPPDIDFLRDHAARIKRSGVSGVMFAPLLRKNGETIVLTNETFSATRFPESDFDQLEKDMATVNWKGLEDSFLRINIVDGQPQRGVGIDWFDDDAWGATLEKVRRLTRLVKKSGLAGTMLDTEEYPPNAFTDYGHQKHVSTRSFKEYSDKALERGKQLAQAMRGEYPGMTVMFTFTTAPFSRFRGSSVFSTLYPRSLQPAFLDGMLQVDGMTFVDGFEETYGARTARDFASASWQLRDAARFSRDPKRYREKMTKGFATWPDFFGNWDPKNEASNYQSPVNFENSLHWALRSSDKYVWVYTEHLDWFGGIVPRHHVPSAAYDKAIVNSRKPHDPYRLPAALSH